MEVNFHTDLIKLIRETRYLDRMGFPIPEIALNVALQVHGCTERASCWPNAVRLCRWAPGLQGVREVSTWHKDTQVTSSCHVSILNAQEDKFLQWLEGLNSMLAKYYEVSHLALATWLSSATEH